MRIKLKVNYIMKKGHRLLLGFLLPLQGRLWFKHLVFISRRVCSSQTGIYHLQC
uniref:Uncharacterized protein n=1 Tax=Anguilla anguilla TaxID=7936 RepID=A0A0E9RJP4_ANGAN